MFFPASEHFLGFSDLMHIFIYALKKGAYILDVSDALFSQRIADQLILSRHASDIKTVLNATLQSSVCVCMQTFTIPENGKCCASIKYIALNMTFMIKLWFSCPAEI